MCPAHLKDKGFCNPIIDEAAIAARKKKEMEAEVERVKQEFEEKQKKRKEKEAAKDKDKDKSKSGDEKIPKTMSFQAFTRIEAVLKKPGQRGFVLG